MVLLLNANSTTIIGKGDVEQRIIYKWLNREAIYGQEKTVIPGRENDCYANFKLCSMRGLLQIL